MPVHNVVTGGDGGPQCAAQCCIAPTGSGHVNWLLASAVGHVGFERRKCASKIVVLQMKRLKRSQAHERRWYGTVQATVTQVQYFNAFIIISPSEVGKN